MRFPYLVQGENRAKGHGRISRRNGVEELLQYLSGQVRGVAAVAGQPYPTGNVAGRVEIRQQPLVRQHPGGAHRAMHPRGMEAVEEGRRTDQVERRIDSPGDEASYLVG